MPSTRKRKAKERRSRQLGIMSDVENVDILLGSYSRDDEGVEQSESELNLDSGSNRPHQNTNLVGEDFRSLLNTNSRENSEMIIETTRLFSEFHFVKMKFGFPTQIKLQQNRFVK